MSLLRAPTHNAIGLSLCIALASLTPLSYAETIPFTSAEFSFATDHLSQFGGHVSETAIEEKVVNNLLEWRFALHLGTKPGQSHRLEVHLGAITDDKTPIGFSFTSGNSDPRAPDFQKARVLPVTCRLIPLNTSKPSRESTLTFSSESSPNSGVLGVKLEAQLVEQISTTCFKLLDDLKLQQPESQGTTPVKTPSWLPSLRIETLPVKTVKAAVSDEKTEPSVSAAKDEQTEAPEVTDETPKQIIIHNQGSPLTLKLGHERL